MNEGGRRWLERDDTTSLTSTTDQGDTGEPLDIGRRPVKKLTTEEVQELDEYFVRVRYNDRIMTIPGCRAEGKHFDGDASLCTLVSLACPFPCTRDASTDIHSVNTSRHSSLSWTSLLLEIGNMRVILTWVVCRPR